MAHHFVGGPVLYYFVYIKVNTNKCYGTADIPSVRQTPQTITISFNVPSEILLIYFLRYRYVCLYIFYQCIVLFYSVTCDPSLVLP